MEKIPQFEKQLEKEVSKLIEVLPKMLAYPTKVNYGIIRKRMISVLYIMQWLEYKKFI